MNANNWNTKMAILAAMAFASAGLLATNAAATSNYQVLHSFSGPDGGGPNSLVLASDGFSYGSTANGGPPVSGLPDGAGVLFRIDPAGNFATLHTFNATDGYNPAGLVQASDGSFYGTTVSGGQPSGGGAGTLFRIDAAGNLTTLYAFLGGFACCDGAAPDGPPIQATDGKFYGVTFAGGMFRDIDHQGGFGTIYSFDPATSGLTIIHSFNLADGKGFFPNGPLVQGTDGLLYGTTLGGGVVFRVDTAGNYTLLRSVTDSGELLAGLIQATDGFFYSTTDGPPGTVFRVDAVGNYSLINRFDGADGYGLNQPLLQASDGFFYGTAPEGGLLDFQAGDLFRLDSTGNLSVLHSFTQTDATGGIIPLSRLVQGADGALYGTTAVGGVGGHGTIFRLDQNIPGPVASVAVQPSMVVPGSDATGKVTLTSPAPTGGTVVALGATSFQVTIPATVIVPAGAKTAKFTIQTSATATAGDVRIYASVGGQGLRTILSILPSANLTSFIISPDTIRGGDNALGTVTLDGPAPAGGAVITLARSSNNVKIPVSVTIVAGATEASFTIQTKHVTRTTNVTMTASYNFVLLSANLTITP